MKKNSLLFPVFLAIFLNSSHVMAATYEECVAECNKNYPATFSGSVENTRCHADCENTKKQQDGIAKGYYKFLDKYGVSDIIGGGSDDTKTLEEAAPADAPKLNIFRGIGPQRFAPAPVPLPEPPPPPAAPKAVAPVVPKPSKKKPEIHKDEKDRAKENHEERKLSDMHEQRRRGQNTHDVKPHSFSDHREDAGLPDERRDAPPPQGNHERAHDFVDDLGVHPHVSDVVVPVNTPDSSQSHPAASHRASSHHASTSSKSRGHTTSSHKQKKHTAPHKRTTHKKRGGK